MALFEVITRAFNGHEMRDMVQAADGYEAVAVVKVPGFLVTVVSVKELTQISLADTMALAKMAILNGQVFCKMVASTGETVEAMLTQARAKPGRHVRVYVYDGATGKKIKKENLPV